MDRLLALAICVGVFIAVVLLVHVLRAVAEQFMRKDE